MFGQLARARLSEKLKRQHLVVFGMIPNPEPNWAFRAVRRERAMMQAHTRGIKIPDLLEPKGGVVGSLLEEFEVLPGQLLDLRR